MVKASPRKTPKIPHSVEPGGLTPEHHDRIFALAEKRWSSRRIAQALCKHPSTVAWFMYHNGLKKRGRGVSITYIRNGRTVRTFSLEEDAFILALSLDGLKPQAICDRVLERFGHPRTYHVVRCRLSMLAGFDEAAEEGRFSGPSSRVLGRPEVRP